METTSLLELSEEFRRGLINRRRHKVFEWEVYNLAAHGFFRGDPEHIADTRPALLAKDLMFDFLTRYY